MRTQTHLLTSKESDGYPSYPQATRGVCGRCRKAFLWSNQHG